MLRCVPSTESARLLIAARRASIRRKGHCPSDVPAYSFCTTPGKCCACKTVCLWLRGRPANISSAAHGLARGAHGLARCKNLWYTGTIFLTDTVEVVMGTGWEYFNNVCQALRVAIGVVASIMGVAAAFLIYGAVAAHLQAAPSDAAPASIYQQGGAPALPDPKSANANTAARGSVSGAGTAAASTNASRMRLPSAAGAATAPRSSSYRPNMQPNSQFGGGSQVNPQFGGGK